MKRAGKMLVIGLFSLLLSGCMFTTPETSLYRLPKLAGEHESLESQIDALLTNGAEYAAPTSGSNLQSVQMIDLDGDGSEETVAFFRRASDKKPMKIYIFKADGDSYERYAVIEGTSSQIYSVNYADLDGDGLKEILVGYKSSSDVQGLAIYPLSPGTSESLLTTGYSRYANLDMNGDGKQELLIICSDEESTARVDYYDWDDGALHAKSSLRLSASVAELSRLTAGTLTGGENALFVTGVTGDNLTVTDVLALKGGRLQNIALGADANQVPAEEIFLGLFPRDENSDGVTEAPKTRPLQRFDRESELQYYVVWEQYSIDGTVTDVQSCFHNVADGWSLVLPDEWDKDHLTVERSAGSGETAVSFYRAGEGGLREKLLTVYTLTARRARDLPTSAAALCSRSRWRRYTPHGSAMHGISRLMSNRCASASRSSRRNGRWETTERRNDMKKVLVLEDEASIRSFIVINLQRAGYEVVEAECGEEALQKLQENPDTKLCLLDIMLPDIDGFEVCRRIRMSNAQVGIIMLTARTQEMDKVTGLMTGADDYVTKPFSPAELTARVDALLRRMGENTPATHTGELYQPPFLLNLTNRTLEKNGERVKLTQIEYAIVKLFMENSGKALAREEILDAVWGKGYFGELKIVDVNVRRLRLKIEDDAQEPKYISTVWGFGYKWTV